MSSTIIDPEKFFAIYENISMLTEKNIAAYGVSCILYLVCLV